MDAQNPRVNLIRHSNKIYLTFRFDGLKINGNFDIYEVLRTPTTLCKQAEWMITTVVNQHYSFEISARITDGELVVTIGRGTGNNTTPSNVTVYVTLELLILD